VTFGSGGLHWVAVSILSAGAFLTSGVRPQRSLDLRLPLGEAVAEGIVGFDGRDEQLSDQERTVAGVSDYLLRSYESPSDSSAWFSVYVGYYATQTEGETIHSPKNCLPGNGWQALSASTAAITLAEGGTASVNRYLLQRDKERALVLYWYQGRGRVAHNEYLVKWDLLRDAAVHRRSEEALVRIVVPVVDSEESALALASSVATTLIPSVQRALPAGRI
jgi:EpsI family protein